MSPTPPTSFESRERGRRAFVERFTGAAGTPSGDLGEMFSAYGQLLEELVGDALAEIIAPNLLVASELVLEAVDPGRGVDPLGTPLGRALAGAVGRVLAAFDESPLRTSFAHYDGVKRIRAIAARLRAAR